MINHDNTLIAKSSSYLNSLIALAFVSIFIISCSSGGEVDIAQRDENQRISRENAALNGKAFARKRFEQVEQIVFDSDSTIKNDCPMGDGWASGDITLAGGEVIPIKCQTYGNGKGDAGCLTEADFASKDDYSSQDGRCDKEMRASGQTVMNKLGI